MGKHTEHKEHKEHKHKTKRKHQADDVVAVAANRGDQAGPGPSSQRAAPAGNKRVKLAVVTPGPSELPAIACYFPAGHPPQAVQYSAYEARVLGKPSYTLVGQQGSIHYVGRTDGDDAAAGAAGTQPCSQVLGVYDKAAGRLTLLPVLGNQPLRMEPRLPGLEYDRVDGPDRVGEDEEETREKTLAENKRLVDSFGSTRRRRQLNAAEAGAVRVEKLGDAAGALSAMMTKLEENAVAQGLSKEQMLAQANAFRHLPPHDLEATTAEAAYPLATLFPDGVAAGLRPGQLIAAAERPDALADMQKKGQLHEYIVSRLPLLRDADHAAAKHRARLLAFLQLLIKFKAGRPTLMVDHSRVGPNEGWARLAQQMRSSVDVLEPLLSLFYTHSSEGSTTRYSRSREQDTLLMSYICVVALLVERGATLAPEHMDALAGHLKMSTADLATRFREVGAVTKSAKRKGGDEGGEKRPSYSATLLPDPSKTLQQCLPVIKQPARAARR